MSEVEELGRRVAETQDEKLAAAARRASVRRRLLESSGPAPRSYAPRVLLAVAAAAVLVLAIFSWRGRRTPALTFTVGDAPAAVGAWVSAPSAGNLPVRFSDGTTVSVDAASRARIATVDERGARIFLEGGAIDVRVGHRPMSNWHFVAGPFDVLVTGTAFRLEWEPLTSRFAVSMREGTVLVSGGIAGAGQSVAAGEVLVADLSLGRLERGTSVIAPASASVEKVAEPIAPPSVSIEAPPPAPSKPAAWRALAAQAKFADALAAAEKAGFSDLCATSPAADVYQLGDIARLARNPSRATEAFTVLRKRFPHDVRAGHAAFALGRVAFDAKGAFGEAASWFEVYLREQPAGAFAKEAAGRAIEAHHRAGATAAARGAAQRYLAAYPDGPHAQLAKSVLGE